MGGHFFRRSDFIFHLIPRVLGPILAVVLLTLLLSLD
jgi:hypothetical protein